MTDLGILAFDWPIYKQIFSSETTLLIETKLDQNDV